MLPDSPLNTRYDDSPCGAYREAKSDHPAGCTVSITSVTQQCQSLGWLGLGSIYIAVLPDILRVLPKNENEVIDYYDHSFWDGHFASDGLQIWSLAQVVDMGSVVVRGGAIGQPGNLGGNGLT